MAGSIKAGSLRFSKVVGENRIGLLKDKNHLKKILQKCRKIK